MAASPNLANRPCGGETWQGWKWARYIYFMRFSILLWLVFPGFVLLDGTGLSAMTRGIVALESRQDVFFAAFFVTAAGWVALLSARIVCAYGESRFDTPPPARLTITHTMSGWLFWGAQVPGFMLLGYVWFQTMEEQGRSITLPQWQIGAFMLLGILAALLCWMLMGAIYYWMFWQTGKNTPPKAFVVPHTKVISSFKDAKPSAPLLGLLLLFENVTRLGEGYCDPDRGDLKLHSGHAFAFLTLGFLAAIYLAFWNFTAPVELPSVRRFVVAIFLIATAVWILLTIRAARRQNAALELGKTIVLFIPLILIVLVAFLRAQPDAMPVLASVTVLLTFLFWGLAGLAFFCDRFRIPVTAVLLAFFLSTQWAVPDHYLSSDPTANVVLPSPSEVLAKFEAQGSNPQHRPAIIVTATGGGIHAAAWTSAVLAKIEETIQQQNPARPGFHDSILLVSTVSGGSVGATPWLTNYLDNSFGRKAKDGVAWEQTASQCSDLRAVAWGLTYADFLRLLFPIRLTWFGKEINRYDRGWALEQAFWRNRQTNCSQDNKEFDETKPDRKLTEFPILDNHKAWIPAFSLNTTTAELGSRYLVGNYKISRFKDGYCKYKQNNEYGSPWAPPPPPASRTGVEIVPAESVLECLQQDISLSTGARLSANFPYVSPMSRLRPPALSLHFGDGGYFDNDGTSTAMEFLWFALNPENKSLEKAAAKPSAQSTSKLPVLLIEIRDGDDPSLEGDAAPKPEDWSPIGQAGGPLETFYKAGHSSATRRNRRELTFLEEALRGKVQITHVVVPYMPPPQKKAGEKNESVPNDSHTGAQPLSWHLTASQKADIRDALVRAHDGIEAAATWFLSPVSTAERQPQTVKPPATARLSEVQGRNRP